MLAFIMQDRELQTTASLAHLSLTDQEAEVLGHEVTRMLEYFSMMRELDVESLDPTTHALSKANRLRRDTEVPGESQSVTAGSLLDNAPELEDRFIVIPNVL
jgi:aspartyl-tRNA(Asn)/glutamyl-tRNA(Gln) amidotransferase subunit C